MKGDVAEIKEEKNQHAGEPRVPHPIGTPGGTAPHGSREKGDKAHDRARRRHRNREHRSHLRLCDKRPDRIEGHHEVREEAHPGARDVNEDDAVGIALPVINRRYKEAHVDTDHGKNKGHDVAADHDRPRGFIKPLWIRKIWKTHSCCSRLKSLYI